MSDAFSSIFHAGNGVVLAGKRTATPGNRIFRSTSNGEPGTWRSVGEIAGFSGAHTYWFGGHGATVITSTGDVGDPCVLRSTDRGATWRVVLTAAQVRVLSGGVDPGAVFSPLFVGGRWIICLRSAVPGRHLAESLDDGVTWRQMNATGLTAGARRMMLTRDGRVMLAGTFPDKGTKPGLFISSDGGATWAKRLDGEPVFAGMEDCGGGVLLVGTYNFGREPVRTKTRERSGGVAIVTTATPHGLVNGSRTAIYAMADRIRRSTGNRCRSSVPNRIHVQI